MNQPRLQIEHIARIVVRGANWVGDAVMTVPALRELRRVFPAAHITLATREWAKDVFTDAPFLDELLILDASGSGSLGSQVKALRTRKFDLAVLFPNAFQPALVATLARVPRRVGYATEWRRLLLTHPLSLPQLKGQRHEVLHYLGIVEGIERLVSGTSRVNFDDPRFDLDVSAPQRDSARLILQGHGISLARPLVGLCPGSTNSRAKRWPAERYAALADRLIEEANIECVLIGSPEEREVTDAVVAQMHHPIAVLTGETSLTTTAGVISLMDLLITNDTGPAHLAAAIDCPTLVIFGPTNPVTTRPLSAHAEIVHQPPDCAPCMLRDCPIDHRCMTAITPADVFARAVSMLERRRELAGGQAHLHARLKVAG